MTNPKIESLAEVKAYVKFLNERRLKSERTWLMVSSEITTPASILTIDVRAADFSSYVFVQTKLHTEFDLEGYKRLHKAYEANRELHECCVTSENTGGYFKPLTAYYARKTWMLLDLTYNLGPTEDGTVNVTIGQQFNVDSLELEEFRKTFTQEQWQ